MGMGEFTRQAPTNIAQNFELGRELCDLSMKDIQDQKSSSVADGSVTLSMHRGYVGHARSLSVGLQGCGKTNLFAVLDKKDDWNP
jgi:hypothetical protein